MAISLIAFNMIGFIGDGRVASVIAGILVILAGFGCSIIYPTIMSIIGDYFLHAQSEAVGFAAMGGGIGGFLFPYMMSAVSTGWGIRIGFAIYALFSLLMVVLNIFLVRAQEQKSIGVSEP